MVEFPIREDIINAALLAWILRALRSQVVALVGHAHCID